MTQQNHEQTVTNVLNFLNAVGAPITRKGGVWGIQERIRWVRERMHRLSSENARFSSELDTCRRALERRVDDLQRALRIVGELLEANRGSAVAEACMMVECSLNPGMSLHDAVQFPVGGGLRDERGVSRVRVDVRDALLELGANSVVHDLDEDEIVCPNCKGVGVVKGASRYGKGGLEKYKTGESAFPYTHEYFAACPMCYMGKVRICLEPGRDGGRCLKAIPRGRTVCDCAAARAKQDAAREKREAERQAKLPRVSSQAYEHPMVFAYKADRFVDVDEVLELLEDGEFSNDEVFFAVRPTDVATRVGAAEIIEKIEEVAYDNSGDSDMVEFTQDAEKKLDDMLEQWFDENVTLREMYYVNNGLIVEFSP